MFLILSVGVAVIFFGAIALSYPLPLPPSRPLPFAIDDLSWKNAAESFTVALTLTLEAGYESAIAPSMVAIPIPTYW